MRHKRHTSMRLLLLFLAAGYAGKVNSQTVTNDFQTRTDVKLSFEPLDKLSLSLNPEIRWDDSFGVSKYMLESGLSYKPVKGLTLGGSYRFIINPRNTKATEYLHRFALKASYKKKIERFEPSLRIKYTNYTEDLSLGEFLRYRAKLEYDIKGSKITPMLSAEAFHYLSGNQIYKMRYALGAEYKLNKKSSISLGYMLDYYMTEYQNKHIINLGYKYKF
jgi:Protein of unknown function (DUF2490)